MRPRHCGNGGHMSTIGSKQDNVEYKYVVAFGKLQPKAKHTVCNRLLDNFTFVREPF